MKKNLLFMLPMAFGLLLGACSESDPTNEEEPAPTPTNKEFKITINELKDSSMTITVTPPEEQPTYFAFLYSDTEKTLGVSDDELFSSIMEASNFSDMIFSGEQSFTYAGLIGHSHYRMICFGYDALLELPSSALYRSERITTLDSPELFDIQISNIGGLTADVSITPPDEELTYYAYIDNMSDYLENFDNNDNLLIQYDYSYWLFISQQYSVPISEVIEADLNIGSKLINTDYWFRILQWDTEYMVYAYGCDNEGNILVPITKRSFKTLKPSSSDNTFEVEIVKKEFVSESDGNQSIYGWDIEASIKASNPNDSYFVTITNKDWYDWFFTEDNKDLPATDEYIMYEILNNNLTREEIGAKDLHLMLKKGDMIYSPRNEYGKLYGSDKEYAVFIFGADENGPTTGLYVFPFFTGMEM